MMRAPSLRRRAELGYLLNDLGLIGVGVEVGVFRGEFAEQILRTWRGSCLFLVDAWKHLSDYLDSWNLSDQEMEDNYELTIRRLAEFSSRIRVLRMRSTDAAKCVADNSCDFIYLDANHAYNAVRDDLNAWYPKLKLGGLMSGHDYFDARADANLDPSHNDKQEEIPLDKLTSYGVRSAVDEFIKPLGAPLFVNSEALPTWYFIKP